MQQPWDHQQERAHRDRPATDRLAVHRLAAEHRDWRVEPDRLIENRAGVDESRDIDERRQPSAEHLRQFRVQPRLHFGRL